jgi:F0F1-type ATP synthase beta subunit
MEVTNTDGPVMAPGGKAVLSRMFDVFRHAIDRPQVEPKNLSKP